MFTDSSHDFGNVARGSKAVYHYKFTNIYEEPAHIASVRSSCGCTSVDEYTKSTLKTWDTGDIVADFKNERLPRRPFGHDYGDIRQAILCRSAVAS